MVEKLAEWLFRYKSYNHRPNGWTQLCEESPDLAEAYRKDAKRCLVDMGIKA